LQNTLQILGKTAVQTLAFGGLALFAVAAGKLSTRSGDFSLPSGSFASHAKNSDSQPREQEETDPRPIVILDPGHGGKDGGTVAGGALEKALNLDTSLRVANLLENNGVRVLFTRDDDSFVELNDRAREANRRPNAVFVSIHHNASDSKTPSGIETYYSYPKPSSVQRPQRELFAAKQNEPFIDRRGEELARRIQTKICDATNASDRGIKNHPFAVTRWVSGPAVLVECGFLSNPAECAKLRTDAYRDKLASGIANGLLEYLQDLANDPMVGVSFPDRVTRPELADIPTEPEG
jgi:N-acetylmuramoyl-L-alanine amidase